MTSEKTLVCKMRWGYFAEIMVDMEKEYDRHCNAKGHTWKSMKIEDLRTLLFKVVDKWSNPRRGDVELDAVVDLALVVMMYGERLSRRSEF